MLTLIIAALIGFGDFADASKGDVDLNPHSLDRETQSQSTPSQSMSASDGEVYSLSFRLFDGDALLGTPTLVVREGQTALIAVTEPRLFAMEVRVDEEAPAALSSIEGFQPRPDHRSIQLAVYFPEQGAWTPVATPTAFVPLREASRHVSDIHGAHVRRDGAALYSETLAVEMTIVEVSQAWLGAASAASKRECSVSDLPSPGKIMAASQGGGAAPGGGAALIGDDDNCCDTGCLTCCNGCCSDSTNRPSGCCSN